MSMTNSDTILVTIWSRLFEQQLMTTLHYRFFTSGTPTDSVDQQLKAFADKLSIVGAGATPLTETMRLCTPSNIDFDRITTQRIKPTRSVYAEAAFEVSGVLDDNALTANVCASITKRSLAPGRKGVGHTQWPPLGSATYASGSLIGGFRTGVLTDFAEALELSIDIGAAGEAWTAIPCLPAGGSVSAYDVTTAVPRSTVRTMHRRTVGLGI